MSYDPLQKLFKLVIFEEVTEQNLNDIEELVRAGF
jgi:hypothetical protein